MIDEEVSVWTPVQGGKFHESRRCAGTTMNRTYVPLDVAVEKGREPCGNCVGDATRVAYRNVKERL